MLSLLATTCAGLFAGAAIYVTLVEHPARLSGGAELAIKEFARWGWLHAVRSVLSLAAFVVFLMCLAGQ